MHRQIGCFSLQLVALALLAPLTVSAEGLSAEAAAQVREATYEVVVPKPPEDGLSYERPPPLELLPFAIRNDHYLSLGTAFAIGPDRWVTAGHVLSAAIESSLGTPMIRGGDGKTYEIAQIEAFSSREDFVVFTIHNGAKNKVLQPQISYRVGEQVHAAGNALGEGIVVRDGSLTSETLEELEGKWKWMRFSAAASPGNSGGPLLDDEGKVIGIVIGKSPNENLNFALPISRVTGTGNTRSHFEYRQSYRIPIMSAATVVHYHNDSSLPIPFTQFAIEMLKAESDFYDQALKQFLTENEASIFPLGTGSQELLTTTYNEKIATLISQQDDGHWDIQEPPSINTSQLSDGVSIQYAAECGWTVLQLKKTANMSVKDLFSDSKLYMDIVLKGVKLTRPVSDQAIRITSLGRSSHEEWFTDRYQRKWQLRIWPIKSMALSLISIAMPRPDGFVALTSVIPTGLLHPQTRQGQYLTSFMYTSLSGSLQEWREFMSTPELQPESLKDTHIDALYDKKFKYSSSRLSFEIGDFVQNIKADSPLTLYFAYFNDKQKVVWDVAYVTLSEDPRQKTYVSFARETRPLPGAPREKLSDWDDMVHQRGAYDGKPHTSDSTAWITSTVSRGPYGLVPPNASVEHLYSITFNAGTRAGGLQNVQNMIMQDVKLSE